MKDWWWDLIKELCLRCWSSTTMAPWTAAHSVIPARLNLLLNLTAKLSSERPAQPSSQPSTLTSYSSLRSPSLDRVLQQGDLPVPAVHSCSLSQQLQRPRYMLNWAASSQQGWSKQHLYCSMGCNKARGMYLRPRIQSSCVWSAGVSYWPGSPRWIR